MNARTTIEELFNCRASKSEWGSELGKLTSWPLDLQDYRSARQVAFDLLVASFEGMDLNGSKPSREVLDGVAARFEAEMDARFAPIPPEQDRNSLEGPSKIIWKQSKRQVLVPSWIDSVEEFKNWFAYELPFGKKFSDWYFFRPDGIAMTGCRPNGYTIVVSCVSDYKAAAARNVWPLVITAATVVGVVFFTHVLLGLFGSPDPDMSFHITLYLLSGGFIFFHQQTLRDPDECFYRPWYHVFIPAALVSSSIVSYCSLHTDNPWTLMGVSVGLVVAAPFVVWAPIIWHAVSGQRSPCQAFNQKFVVNK